MKDEDLLDASKPTESSHLSPEVMGAQRAFLLAMKTVCRVFNEFFRNLDKTHGLQGYMDLAKSVHLRLCDPPYNIRYQQVLEKMDPEVFNAKDMELYFGFAKNVLKHGGYEHSFSFFCRTVCILVTAFSQSNRRGGGGGW